MPTYVYECRTCGKVFEVEQRIVEDALTDCDCGAKGALRRLIQPVAVAFKGAGFHINDYASKSSPTESTETKSEPSSPATTSAETKSDDSKPVESSTPATTEAPKP
jgi:putative FmdB family regulatory protein